ncbi:MAG: metallophosphoesterase [Planctomycetales bacterium]|nr:metallophosphoesterase [Planctomycetales bacterium]
MQAVRSRRKTQHTRTLSIETLTPREMLAADLVGPLPLWEWNGAVAAVGNSLPQYTVHQSPRLQLGNAPVYRSHDYIGMDQVDIVWQTKSAGEGSSDRFVVSYREVGEDAWKVATPNPLLDTDVETRIVHSATLSRLRWDTKHEYKVELIRDDLVVESYGAEFQSRLRPGDATPFSFAVYGDSATAARIDDFRRVQAEISRRQLDFSLLTGDVVYNFGTHQESDIRFVPDRNPEATAWTASHIDFIGYGNHDTVTQTGRFASSENYANPIPVAGQNAFASLPETDVPERNYSFDYGDVHFATIDTTDLVSLDFVGANQRITDRLDYLETTLAESDAAWKIVYVHTPIGGTEKATTMDYFQNMVNRLNQADVDLLFVGDSHTYSWTYPLEGFDDANQDGRIQDDEIQFDASDRFAFQQSDGVVQVVTGVGGYSLRSHPYPDPFIAAGYSTHDDTGPIEFGFAQVDVTEQQLTVSYISAATGQIVGDTNGNGQHDADELYFGRFSIERNLPVAEPQYAVKQPPRIQLGNAPLIGTPAFDGFDQVDLLWQTVSAGNGTDDSFTVEIRRSGTDDWTTVPLNESLDTDVATRTIHSATIRPLDWNTEYEYRVRHWRSNTVLDTYRQTFKTRLAPGDESPFTFVSYGDSAVKLPWGKGFIGVQSAISELDPEFALLLGDNLYDFGSHDDADARFDPVMNPAASYWSTHKFDYFAIGNHDVLNLNYGQASADSFSVPIPVAGENAVAAPSDFERPEFNYAFDYGDVHFVTIDTNSIELGDPSVRTERLAAQLDYLVQDMQASDATWKIVFAHHPLTGTAKAYSDTNGEYFKAALPRLQEAGVDLIMHGDSHTFSWTYPLTGMTDRNADGVISPNEVDHVAGSRDRFLKDQGVVQLVSGVGGRSLRSDAYTDPYFANAYSQAEQTGPLEFGFAKLDVSPDQLVVSYISSATGHIVGDTNQNGVKDLGEDDFGQFRIVANHAGDLNLDGQLDSLDIDTICFAVLAEDTNRRFDLNQDGQINRQDHLYLVQRLLETNPGDANLDGVVNSQDLVQVFTAGEYDDHHDRNSTWSTGDWNCDGDFDSRDLVLVFQLGVWSDQ